MNKCFSDVFFFFFSDFSDVFLLSCSQGFLSTRSFFFFSRFLLFSRINFFSRIKFFFERFIFLPKLIFSQDFFDWLFKRSLFAQRLFSQGFFLPRVASLSCQGFASLSFLHRVVFSSFPRVCFFLSKCLCLFLQGFFLEEVVFFLRKGLCFCLLQGVVMFLTTCCVF